MAPGLQGPAGGPCKSGDITGWGLITKRMLKSVSAFVVSTGFDRASAGAKMTELTLRHIHILFITSRSLRPKGYCRYRCPSVRMTKVVRTKTKYIFKYFWNLAGTLFGWISRTSLMMGYRVSLNMRIIGPKVTLAFFISLSHFLS